MSNTLKHDGLLERLSVKYNKPVDVIKKVVESQFEFIVRDKIRNIDFNDIKDKDEFDGMKKTFLIKYLFKLSPSWNVVKKYKEIKDRENEIKCTGDKEL